MKPVVYTICSLILAFISFCNKADAQCPDTQPSVYGYNSAGDSATISWSAVSTYGYEYSIQPAAASQPTSGIAITNTMIRIGNLQPGTAYKAWLRTNCGNGVYTQWVSISFSTPCGTPATVNISGIWGDSATISWTAVGPAGKYEYVADTVVTAPTGNGTSVTGTKVTVKGLISARNYYVFVRTQCGSSIYSPWSPVTSFFSASPTQINGANIHGKVSVYPNPVANVLYINSIQGMQNISLFNYQGNIVYQAKTANISFIDLSNYPAGMYLLKFSGEAGTTIVKIEKL